MSNRRADSAFQGPLSKGQLVPAAPERPRGGLGSAVETGLDGHARANEGDLLVVERT